MSDLAKNLEGQDGHLAEGVSGERFIFNTSNLATRLQSLMRLARTDEQRTEDSFAEFSTHAKRIIPQTPQEEAEYALLLSLDDVIALNYDHRKEGYHQMARDDWRMTADVIDYPELENYRLSDKGIFTISTIDLTGPLIEDLTDSDAKIILERLPNGVTVVALGRDKDVLPRLEIIKKATADTQEVLQQIWGTNMSEDKRCIVLFSGDAAKKIIPITELGGAAGQKEIAGGRIGISIIFELSPNAYHELFNNRIRMKVAHELAHGDMSWVNNLGIFIREGYAQLVHLLVGESNLSLVHAQMESAKSADIKRVTSVVDAQIAGREHLGVSQFTKRETYIKSASLFATIYTVGEESQNGRLRKLGQFLDYLSKTGDFSRTIKEIYNMELSELQEIWRTNIRKALSPSLPRKGIGLLVDTHTGEPLIIGRQEIEAMQRRPIAPDACQPWSWQATKEELEQESAEEAIIPVVSYDYTGDIDKALGLCPIVYKDRVRSIFEKAMRVFDTYRGNQDKRNRRFEERILNILRGDFDWWLPEAESDYKDQLLTTLEEIFTQAEKYQTTPESEEVSARKFYISDRTSLDRADTAAPELSRPVRLLIDTLLGAAGNIVHGRKENFLEVDQPLFKHIYVATDVKERKAIIVAHPQYDFSRLEL